MNLIDCLYGEGALADHYMVMLALCGYDTDCKIELNHEFNVAGRSAEARMNASFADTSMREANKGRIALFGSLYFEVLEGNVPRHFRPGLYNRAWRNAQRRVRMMMLEGANPASFNEADDLSFVDDQAELEELRGTSSEVDTEPASVGSGRIGGPGLSPFPYDMTIDDGSGYPSRLDLDGEDDFDD